VSQYRDALSPQQVPGFDQRTGDFAQQLADACAEQARIVATEGPRAAAEQAWYPGHPLGTVEAIQARYEQLQDETRRQKAGAA
jgi:hypothetical protein